MIEPLYVAARGVLLDALYALGDQREVLILTGDQAIYIHTGAADRAVAEFTTDGDLVVNPEQLKTMDPADLARTEAGLTSGSAVGPYAGATRVVAPCAATPSSDTPGTQKVVDTNPIPHRNRGEIANSEGAQIARRPSGRFFPPNL